MRKDYQAYLLRLWRVGAGENHAWRVMLEDTRTHQINGFSSLEELVRFLQQSQQRQDEEPACGDTPEQQ